MSAHTGPVTIGETVFLKVKRCPLCDGCNTDDSILKKGPWGVENFLFLAWNRGTPENPVGRFDRICVITFEQGGFDTEYTNVDAFIAKRKDCRKTWDEWSAARKVTIEILESSDSTYLGKLMNTHYSTSIQAARTRVVRGIQGFSHKSREELQGNPR